MTKKVEKVDTDRRGFMKLAALGAAAGGATLASGQASAAEAPKSATAAGYRESEHVKTFYKSARF